MEDLRKLLSTATGEQLDPLVAILDTCHCRYSSPEQIVQGVQWMHRNLFESFHREVFGESESYADVLCTLLKKVRIIVSPRIGCEALEELLVKKIFEQMWLSFNETQRVDFNNTVQRNLSNLGSDKELLQVGGVIGLMAAAKLGGFGTYLLASSALHGIAGTLGITAPFGMYKAVSSAISIALGPIGFIGVSIFAIYKLTGTDYTKLIPAAMYIALLRYELQARPNKILGRQVIAHAYASKRGVRLL